jgi:hypothetical protein
MQAQGVGRGGKGCGWERTHCRRWLSQGTRLLGSLATLAGLACGHAEPAANVGPAASAAPRPEQVVQSINPAPAAAAKSAEPPSSGSSAVQVGVQASARQGAAANTSAALGGSKSDGAAPGNQITMKHVEAELNRLEAELGQ